MSERAVPAVLIVEDDESLRCLIATLLTDAAYAAVQAGSGEEALSRAADTRLDLAVLDVGLPGLSGYEVCRRLRERPDGTFPIMFVSGTRTDALDRVVGLAMGADDYLVKPFAPEELLARVRALLRRGRTGAVNGDAGLTPRERQVLRLLAEGRSQPEIAGELVISPKTVATHLERIIGKLGVHNRAQAVAQAYRRGLLED